MPVIQRNLETGGGFERSALVVASWARYAEGVDESGEPIEVVDRHRDKVMAAARRYEEDELAFLRDRDFFGGLVDSEPFTTAYAAFLKSLHDNGARVTLEDLESNR